MSSEIIYVMDCGCEITEKDIIRIRIISHNGKPTSRYACKEHPDSMLKSRKTKCAGCNKIFSSGIVGYISALCKPCRYEKQKKQITANNRRKKSLKNKKNTYGCKRFSELCKSCILPHFKCKIGLNSGGVSRSEIIQERAMLT